ncbi:WD repeat protein [Niveomyces insectorum RCEF 264]|uniref:WD repeat protein n=1 Tax=Niveomyces insectorum RCEF 264 TaxID=1081102 RepID=A0A167TWZ9_9HYPO|nr:WD repeat protein [Niveomyces insectorum RCEF 264]
MQTSDAQRFFETDAAQELRARRSVKSTNKYGNPVVLKSKILAVLADPTSPSHVFVAESAACARRVDVDGGDTKQAYRGPTAPVTCLALGGPGGQTLFAGSWDKTVWSFDRATRQPGRTYAGHADFVKTVVCGRLAGRYVLLSGGADARIIVWDVAAGTRLHTLRDRGGGSAHTGGGPQGRPAMLAVQALAIDPVATTADELWVVSASSDPYIRRWRVRLDGWEQVVDEAVGGRTDGAPRSASTTKSRSKGEVQAPGAAAAATTQHETTVYKLVFDDRPDDDGEVDLWSASGDGTVKCLARRYGFLRARDNENNDENNTLVHSTHVRAVAVTEAWVITAGRDENLHYWDRTGVASAAAAATDGKDDFDEDDDDDNGNGGCYATVTGHYDEVTDLVVLADGKRLCSVSLDGTVRTWPLDKAGVDALVRRQKEDRAKGPDAAADDDDDDEVRGAAAKPENAMTAEEEAELAALMDDD